MKPIYALLIVILFCQMLFAAEAEPKLLFPTIICSWKPPAG